ncbi:MAG: MFS transporter [Bacteroidales bacterium]|nr:MFS transporter [Lentimicrobiaceae bacterium]MDD5696019.1 MFS transporter [Bacteroidales bacterium]
MHITNNRSRRYRWVVLLVYFLLAAMIQVHWITFAPITVEAIGLYNTSAFWIVLLSMSFMVIYIAVSAPASYIIDRYGLRLGVGIGAVLMAVFGYLKGALGHDYTIVCVSQFGLAIAQPFVLNATTKIASDWFPVNERATATGIGTLAQFVGILLAMAITKPLAQSFLPDGISDLTIESVQSTLKVYGLLSIAVALIFLVLIRDNPPVSFRKMGTSTREHSGWQGIGQLFRQRDMVLLLFVFFIGLGLFNALTTYIDLLLASKGYLAGGNESGLVGAVMMGSGIAGAVVIPVVSDKIRRRKAVLLFCLVALLPGLAGLSFFTGFTPLVISSGILGFFIMGAAPVGFQYAAEVSHPVPESTSLGMILLSGQVSGILFILIMGLVGNVTMEAFANARKASESLTMTPIMIGFVILSVINVFLAAGLNEYRPGNVKMNVSVEK